MFTLESLWNLDARDQILQRMPLPIKNLQTIRTSFGLLVEQIQSHPVLPLPNRLRHLVAGGRLHNMIVLLHGILRGAGMGAETLVLHAADGDVGTASALGSSHSHTGRRSHHVVRTLSGNDDTGGASTVASRSFPFPLGRTGQVRAQVSNALYPFGRCRRIAAGRLHRAERTIFGRFTETIRPQGAVGRVLGGDTRRSLWYFRWHFATGTVAATGGSGTAPGASNANSAGAHVDLRGRIVGRVGTLVYGATGCGNDCRPGSTVPG